MKFSVTKRQVIKAIETEPLLSGTWVHTSEEDSKFKNNTQCPVCAVGSILDIGLGKHVSPSEIDEIGSMLVREATFACCALENGQEVNTFNTSDLKTKAKELAKKGEYLSALSGLYEGLSQRDEMKTQYGFANNRLRRILINFVKTNFPGKLNIDTRKEY